MYDKIENYVSKGKYNEALKLIETEYSNLSENKIEDKIKLLGNKALIFLRIHRMSEALDSAENLYALYSETGDLSLKGFINHIYGLTYYRNQNFVKANQFLKSALSLALESEDEELEVKILDTLGQYYMDYGDISNAIYYFKRSERKKTLLKDFQGLAITYGNLGRLYFISGNFKKAREYFYLDYKLSKDINDHFGQAIMLNQIGLVERMIKNTDISEKSFKGSLKISKEMDYKLSEGFSLTGLGHTALMKGNIEKSREYANRAREIFEEFEKKDGLIEAYLLKAKINHHEKNTNKTEELLQKAERIARDSNFNYEMSQVLIESANLYFDRNQIDEGLERVDWFFQSIQKISEDEETVYRYIIKIARDITEVEDVVLLLKRDNVLELIKINRSADEFFSLNRKIIGAWSAIQEIIEEQDDIKSSVMIEKWLKDKRIINMKNSLVAMLRRQGERFGLLIAMSNRPFKKQYDELNNILNSYSDKISDIINNTISILCSNYDNLTRLKNRQSLYREIEEEIYKSQVFRKDMGILLVDIDNFKRINDEFGHLKGDLFLVNMADILRNIVRKSELIFRIGGDEFLILLRNIKKKNAINISEKIIKRIKKLANPYNLSGLKISASVGIYIDEFYSKNIDYDEINTKELINKADIALRKAKRTGKSNYYIYGTN